MESYNRPDQTIDLLDGRKLGYAEYGPIVGKPVMLFGGASGRYLKPCSDELLEEFGVRLILAERPGYGLSEVRDFPEVYRQGGRGAAHDIYVVCHPWSFRPEEIRAKTFVWQGEADPNVPPVMGRYFAKAIPDCTATFIPGAGHMLFYTHFGQILQQVVAHGQEL